MIISKNTTQHLGTILLLLGTLACSPLPSARGAAEEFVGVLALAVEDATAKSLALTDAQKTKLQDLIEARESAAIDLAIELKDATAQEREAKLAAYRQESEAKGLLLLTPQQREELLALRDELAGEEAIETSDVPFPPAPDASAATPLVPVTPSVPKTPTTPKAASPVEPSSAVPATKPPLATTDAADDAADEPAGAAGETSADELADESTLDRELELLANAVDSAGKTPADAQEPKQPGKLRFSFRYAPWKDVIDWFVQQAGLSLVTDSYPPGTFNYSDNRERTPEQALDVLNSVLLTKGYTLIRREKALMLINLEDGIPPNLIEAIKPEELDDKGDYELVSVIFQLDRMSPDEAEAEVKKLLGPQGHIVGLAKSRQIQVTETARRLRAIRDVIERIEDPSLISNPLRSFTLKYAAPSETLPIIRQMLDIPEDRNAAPDGSVRLAVDALGKRLLVSGKADKLARIEEILEFLDVPKPGEDDTDPVDDTPQLEVYSITTADPQTVLAVMQTLLAGQSDVRLALDAKTGNLVALARPMQHATIRATLEQMQRDARLVEVIRLRVVDPQVAVISINRMFNVQTDPAKGPANPSAPVVEADPVTRQLIVRGTKTQIEQVRSLLEKLGEDENAEDTLAGQKVRTLPLKGATAEAALKRMQEIWPTLHKNKIRIVTPSATIPSVRISDPDDEDKETPAAPLLPHDEGDDPSFQREPPSVPAPDLDARNSPPKPKWTKHDAQPSRAAASNGAAQPRPTVPTEQATAEDNPGTPRLSSLVAARSVADRAKRWSTPVMFVADVAAPPAPAATPAAPPVPRKRPEASGDNKSEEPAPIIVAPGPGGMVIASDDIEALDQFEQLMNSLSGGQAQGGPEMTVFYLKHAKAAGVAETLDRVLGGTSTDSSDASGGGGGGLLGDIAGAALGDRSGLLGSLLGGGGGGGDSLKPTGAIKITPDSRLNALVVQANAADTAMIEQLLKILDQKGSPEDVLIVPKAKIIPIMNTQAQEVADILKQVYQDRMVASGGQGGQPRPPSPQEFMQMLRGGRGGGRGQGGQGGQAAEEQQKMTVSVDARTNSLIVAAPEPLFNEIETLIQQLDQAATTSNQTMKVVTLHNANSQTVQQALRAIAGESIQMRQQAAQPTRQYNQRQGGMGMPGMPGGMPQGMQGFGGRGGMGNFGQPQGGMPGGMQGGMQGGRMGGGNFGGRGGRGGAGR